MLNYREAIYKDYHSNQVNKTAASYSSLIKQQEAYYSRELIPLIRGDKSQKLVDLGCGFGSFLSAAKSNGYHNVEGVDLSPEQVAVAHELGLTEIKNESIDAYFERSAGADCIVGVDIIEHFSKDELMDFLTKCKKHLNKGGQVIFRTPNMDATMASVYAFADISHEVFLNKSSALQIMKSAGFKNVEVLPSLIWNQNPIKEFIRKILWTCHKMSRKFMLFSSGRTWNEVVFTPNIIIRASKD
ncbi:MAG: methyltransferase domain-containing protein [Bacteroidia bacterium]